MPAAMTAGRGRGAARLGVIIVLPAVVATVVSVLTARANPGLGYLSDRPMSMLVAGIAGVVLLLRRRFPLTVALVTAAAFAGDTVVLPLAVAVYTIAFPQRSWWHSAVGMAAAVAAVAFTEGPPNSWPSRLTGMLLVVAVPALVGVYVGARRTMIAGLRERAQAAEKEALLAADNARLAERTRIARDMHDILGHRVTIISVQAAALEVMPAAADPAVQERVRIIADTAREALGEVRDVLGLLDRNPSRAALRLPAGDGVRGTEDIARVAARANELGITTRYRADVVHGLTPADADLLHHVVQEGLTNAAKHAPGGRVDVSLDDRDGVQVTIENTPPVAGAPDLSGALDGGQGLANLRTRLREVGGLLTASPTDDGGFRLVAWLPGGDRG